jgi:hypothetical protein
MRATVKRTNHYNYNTTIITLKRCSEHIIRKEVNLEAFPTINAGEPPAKTKAYNSLRFPHNVNAQYKS